MHPQKVILASASPRRRRFLTELGIVHTATAADMDESPLPDESPQGLALRLARSKAVAVANRLPSDQRPALVIGADTVVALDGVLLGKPADEAEATTMLNALRGRVHQVHSGLVILHVAQEILAERSSLNTTNVTMRNYTNNEIARYVASGDPFDKAGGYAIQHRGFDPVARLEGCPSGVMGLPAADLLAILADFGVTTTCPLAPVCHALTGLVCCQQSADNH